MLACFVRFDDVGKGNRESGKQWHRESGGNKGKTGYKAAIYRREMRAIKYNLPIILWAILQVAVLSGAVTFFMLLSIAWTHEPIGIREFLKLCVAEIQQVLTGKKSGSGKEKVNDYENNHL